MNYCRKTANNTANDVKLKMQIGALAVKITENINKINNLLEVDKNIKNDISSNLAKIGDNETNISSNLGKINSNKDNIRNNYNISQISKKKSEFNTSLIDNNIESLKSIKNDIVDYYKLKDIIIFDIKKTNISEDISINLPKFVIIQSNLNNIF